MKSAIIEAAEYLEGRARYLRGFFGPCEREHEAERIAQRLRAEADAQPAIPEGWKLVPVEPTDEMQRALHGIYGEARRRWSAALEVAPSPPASEVEP